MTLPVLIKINFSHARRWTNKLLRFFPTVHFYQYMNLKKNLKNPEAFGLEQIKIKIMYAMLSDLTR